MANRLPNPGSDQGQWGQILNDYLSVEHNADGTLKKATDIAAKYTKPSTGIPAGDLSTAVQTSLTKADSSVQSVNAIFPNSGNITLNANDVSAIPLSQKGVAGGVAVYDTTVAALAAKGSKGAIRWFEDDYGAVGDSTTNDTAALNAGLLASATNGFIIMAKPTSIFKIGITGSKNFINPSGATITKNYGVEIPTGARVNWNGATILAPAVTSSGQDFIALTNKRMSIAGDVIECRNLIVDGSSRAATSRTVPLVWFWGLDRSRIERITLQNASYVAGQLSALTNSFLDQLNCRAITGQGWIIGGNNYDQLADCIIGTCYAEDVATYGTFNQPGNGFCIGGQRLKIQALYARNCAGGHKYMPGSTDIHTDYAEFDGTVGAGEPNNNTSNSGTKVQGDAPDTIGNATANGTTSLTSVTANTGSWSVGQCIYGPQVPWGTKITAVGTGTLTLTNAVPTGSSLSISGGQSTPPDRVSFTKIVSRNCAGIGFYGRYAGNVRIGNYYGYKNARNGTDYDFDAASINYLEVDSYRADWPGFSGVGFGSGMTRVHFGACVLRNCGDVTTASVSAFQPGSGDIHVGYLEIIDDRSTAVAMQGIAVTGTVPLTVDRYRCFNVSASIRLFSPQQFVGSPLISSGTDALQGTVTLGASTTTTTINNSNVKSFSYNSGYVQPIIELTPLNSSAQALGVVRYAVPSNFNLRLNHGTAAGTEVFAYRICGYTWMATQLS